MVEIPLNVATDGWRMVVLWLAAGDGDRLLDAEHGVLAAALGVHEGGDHVLEAGYLMSATLDLDRVEDAIKRLAVTAGPLKG